jgi:arylformamidase
MSQKIIDLSYNLDDDTPFFIGLPAAEIIVHASIPPEHPPGTPGAGNISSLKTNLHVGTHMDAPFHFYQRGPTIDQTNLERCIGAALLIDLTHKQANEEITARDLAPYRTKLLATNKVILHTGWAKQWKQANYFDGFPVIGVDAAQLLVECGVDLVGVDTPSVDNPPYSTHFALLGHQLLIVENLTNLDQIGQEHFQLIALPLKITGRDASPVRVVALVDGY